MNPATTTPPPARRPPRRGRIWAALAAACVLAFAPASARGGGLLYKLTDDAPESAARAYARSIARGNAPLGFTSVGRAGERNFGSRRVTVRFAAESSGVRIAAFSDDGVTVSVTDLTADAPPVAVLTNRGVGQALPVLEQSFHELDYTFEAGRSYELTVDYLNTLYTGGGDIDGALLIAYGGTIEHPCSNPDYNPCGETSISLAELVDSNPTPPPLQEPPPHPCDYATSILVGATSTGPHPDAECETTLTCTWSIIEVVEGGSAEPVTHVFVDAAGQPSGPTWNGYYLSMTPIPNQADGGGGDVADDDASSKVRVSGRLPHGVWEVTVQATALWEADTPQGGGDCDCRDCPAISDAVTITFINAAH